MGALNKFYGDTQILKNISFEIGEGEKVGLIGKNGSGKTTLFNILTRRIDFESGDVSIPPFKTVGVIDQMPTFPEHFLVEDVLRRAFANIDDIKAQMRDIEKFLSSDPGEDRALLTKYGDLSAKLESLNGYNKDYEVNMVANGLGITADLRDRRFSVLSGGEKTRVNLARVILEAPDILLLDEPTNHLDIASLEWLGEFISSYRGTALIISHDRYFLDDAVERIIEIENGEAVSYQGNYSFFAIEKEKRLQEAEIRFEEYEREKKRLESAASRLHSWGTQSVKMHKRGFAIEKRIEKLRAYDRPKRSRNFSFSWKTREYLTEDVLSVKNLSKGFEGKALFSDLSFDIKNGERVAIIGDNGCGKTTLLKIILGKDAADAGTVKKGPFLKPAYLPQNVTFPDMSRSLKDTLIYSKNLSSQSARDSLGAFGFSGDDQLRPVSSLSGGEKSRLRLCMLMQDEVNMLILDEPTNHLDIASRETIESAIDEFPGTMLFVSHDRYFLSRFATRIIMLSKDKIIDFPGGYERFREYLLRNGDTVSRPQSAAGKSKKEARPSKSKLARDLPKEISKIEREISAVESKALELRLEMEKNASDADVLFSLSSELESLESESGRLYEKWQSLLELEEDITTDQT